MLRPSTASNNAVTVAFCAGTRTVGAAVLFGTTLGSLVTTRIRRTVLVCDESIRVRRWAERLLACHSPAVVILFEGDVRSTGARRLDDVLAEAAGCRDARLVPVQRAEVARAIGLETEAANALVAWLRGHRLPVLDAAVRPNGWRGGLRSESERYHEPAMLAAAAGLSILSPTIRL